MFEKRHGAVRDSELLPSPVQNGSLLTPLVFFCLDCSNKNGSSPSQRPPQLNTQDTQDHGAAHADPRGAASSRSVHTHARASAGCVTGCYIRFIVSHCGYREVLVECALHTEIQHAVTRSHA